MLADGARAAWGGFEASGGHGGWAGAPCCPCGCVWLRGPAWGDQAAAGSPGGGSRAVGGAAKPEARSPPGGGGVGKRPAEWPSVLGNARARSRWELAGATGSRGCLAGGRGRKPREHRRRRSLAGHRRGRPGPRANLGSGLREGEHHGGRFLGKSWHLHGLSQSVCNGSRPGMQRPGIDSEGALEVQRRVGWARAGVSEALVCVGGGGGSLGACRRWEGSCGGKWDGVQSRRCFFLEKKNVFLHGADGGSACHSFYPFG